MSNILAVISSVFSKAFILGTVIPATIFVFISLALVRWLFPANAWVYRWLATRDTLTEGSIITLGIFILSALLYNIYPLISGLYEGHYWKGWLVGQQRIEKYKGEYIRAGERCKAMEQLQVVLKDDQIAQEKAVKQLRSVLDGVVKYLQSNSKNDQELIKKEISQLQSILENQVVMRHREVNELLNYKNLDDIDDKMVEKAKIALNHVQEVLQKSTDRLVNVTKELNKCREKVPNEYLQETDMILPTRLGNTIGVYWLYPYQRYQIKARKLWPRLRTIMDKDYFTALENAEVPLRFMLNCSALCIFPAIVLVFAGVYYHSLTSQSPLWLWMYIAGMLLCLGLFYVCYWLAIKVTDEWGEVFKGAFDLYRRDMLAKLGYKRTLTTWKEELDLWEAISHQTEDPNLSPNSLLDYDVATPPAPLTYARDRNGTTVGLEVARGIELLKDDRYFTVVLRIKNVDTSKQTRYDVIVTDTLLEGCDYKWGSANYRLSKDTPLSSVPVEGTNPYHFHIGSLVSDQETLLRYQVIPRKNNRNVQTL